MSSVVTVSKGFRCVACTVTNYCDRLIAK